MSKRYSWAGRGGCGYAVDDCFSEMLLCLDELLWFVSFHTQSYNNRFFIFHDPFAAKNPIFIVKQSRVGDNTIEISYIAKKSSFWLMIIAIIAHAPPIIQNTKYIVVAAASKPKFPLIWPTTSSAYQFCPKKTLCFYLSVTFIDWYYPQRLCPIRKCFNT